MKLTIITNFSEIKDDKKGRPIHDGLMLLDYLLDHALLYKKGIIYDEEKKVLNLYLIRNDFSPVLRKVRIFKTWTREKFKKISCKLTINNVIKYRIIDDAPFDKEDEEIIIAGIDFDKEGLYIGSWCHCERDFEIIIEVDSIFISLEDNDFREFISLKDNDFWVKIGILSNESYTTWAYIYFHPFRIWPPLW